MYEWAKLGCNGEMELSSLNWLISIFTPISSPPVLLHIYHYRLQPFSPQEMSVLFTAGAPSTGQPTNWILCTINHQEQSIYRINFWPQDCCILRTTNWEPITTTTTSHPRRSFGWSVMTTWMAHYPTLGTHKTALIKQHVKRSRQLCIYVGHR